MRPPISISPRADGKVKSPLLIAGRTDTIVGEDSVEIIAVKLESDDDTRNNEGKRSMSFHSRFGWPSINKTKIQQRQPHQELSRQQQLNEECRQPPPKPKPKSKQTEFDCITQAGKKIDERGIPMPAAAALLTVNDHNNYINTESAAKNETSKYIPLRQRLKEREKRSRDAVQTKANRNTVRKSSGKINTAPKTMTSDTKKELKELNSSCAPPEIGSKSSQKEAGVSDSVKNESARDKCNSSSDNTCLDDKFVLLSQAANTVMSGVSSAYLTLMEVGQNKVNQIVPMETNNPGIEVPARIEPCPFEVNLAGCDVRVPDQVVPFKMGHGCCRIELDEDEPSDELMHTFTNADQDTTTVGYILNDLDPQSIAEVTLKRTVSVNADIVTVSQKSTTAQSERNQKQVMDPGKIKVDNVESNPAETEQLILLKRAIAAAQEREKLYLTSQRYMEEKISSLQRELDAERKVVQDQEEKLNKQSMHRTNHGTMEETQSQIQEELETKRVLVCQEKELKKSRSLLGDLQKRVNHALVRVRSSQANIEPSQAKIDEQRKDRSFSELEFALKASLSKSSESDMESDGNSSISSATGLASTAQGVIGNISLVEMSSTTEDDIELEVIGNGSRLEEIDVSSTGSKTDYSSGSLSPEHSGVNDESTSSRSFTDHDSLEDKYAAWRWFRSRLKEIRTAKGDESNPTSIDTSFECNTEDEVGSSNSSDYTPSSDNSASASMYTETTAEIDFQNSMSYRSNSYQSTSSELDRYRSSSSSKSIEEQLNLSPKNDGSGLGLLTI